MSLPVYYYSGTGNSLWVARQVGAELPDSELVAMTSARSAALLALPEVAGLVFPVHMWGIPPRVRHFARGLAARRPGYVFAVAVNGGQVVRTLFQLDRVLRGAGARLDSGFSVIMPSNYTPFGGPGTAKQQGALFAAAREKARRIALAVRGRERLPPEQSSLWENSVFSPLNRMVTPLVPRMDRFFRADARCNGCGVCARICPAGNIRLEEGRPLWQHRCEQCWACFHWCPETAIQYGRSTRGRPRYHHPEIGAGDILPFIG